MKEKHFFSAVDASDQKNKEMYAQAKQNAEIVFVFYSYLLKNKSEVCTHPNAWKTVVFSSSSSFGEMNFNVCSGQK